MKFSIFNKLLTVLTVLLLSSSGYAQYYQIGEDPWSTKWRLIEGDHFSVIFPNGLDSLAHRYLFLFEKTRTYDCYGLGRIETSDIPIILHPYALPGNGSVTWAPRRLDIFTTPLNDALYTQDWETSLAIHEGRHIGQMNLNMTGFFGLVSKFFGEQTIAIGAGLYPSSILLEGDAVMTETEYTGGGRGRNPDFTKYYRAAFLSGEQRSYNQWKFGSYKYFAPDNYSFGYVVTSTMRYNSGNYNAVGDIIQGNVKDWYKFSKVSKLSYQNAIGCTYRENWNRSVTDLTSLWRKEFQERAPYNEFESLLDKGESLYTNFTQVLPSGNSTYAVKQGMLYSTHLVSIDSTGKQRVVKPISSNISQIMQDDSGSLYFTEVVPDVRWGLRNYSIVRRFDTKTGMYKNITRRTRYFNPAPMGRDTILVVEYLVQGGSRITGINKITGGELFSVEVPDGGQLMNVTTLGEDIYASVIKGNDMSIWKTDASGAKWERVLDAHNRSVKYLKSYGDSTLYFVSDLDGISNVYLFKPTDGSLNRVTSSRFGVTHPFISNEGYLYYSDYDKQGYQPVRAELSSLTLKEASFENPFRFHIPDSLTRQARETVPQMTSQEEEVLAQSVSEIESEPFRKVSHLMHIHSWMPIYANIDRIMSLSYEQIYQVAAPGVTLLSQNLLGTAVTMLGYSYHNGFHAGHINFNYSGLYPVFEFSADFNDRFRMNTNMVSVKMEDGTKFVEYKTERLDDPSLEMKASVYIPFNFSHSGWNSTLIPQIRYSGSNDKYSFYGKNYKHKSDIIASVRYSKVRPHPVSKVYPRWGFGVVASGRWSIGPHDASGKMGYFNAYGYVPGILRNQGVKLSACYQKQIAMSFYGYLANLASVPRGYEGSTLMDYAKFSIDYAIPHYLGDFSLGPLYMKRVVMIPFADYALNWSRVDARKGYQALPGREVMSSQGMDVIFNGNVFSIKTEFSVGLRYARTRQGTNYFSLLAGIEL